MMRLWLALTTCVTLASCDNAAKPAVLAPPDQTYTVAGTIEQLPGEGRPLIVHHEAIPEFVGKDGRIVGMREMSMEFAHVAPEVDMAACKVGDRVMMTFEVRWATMPRARVTALVPRVEPSEQK